MQFVYRKAGFYTVFGLNFETHVWNLVSFVPVTVCAVCMGETSASRWLGGIVAEFSKLYPDVKFDLFSGTADIVKERIEKGLLDAGLLIEPTVDLSKYDLLRIPVKDRWGVLVAAGDPLFGKEYVTSRELEGRRLFVPARLADRLEEIFGIPAADADIFVTHNLLYNAASMVKYGAGAAITVSGATELYDSRELSWKPFYPELPLSSVLVWKKYNVASPSAAKFLEFVDHSIRL